MVAEDKSPMNGPKSGEILTIIQQIPVGNLTGLVFEEIDSELPFDADDFERIVSDGALIYYRDTVSQVELDHYQSNKIHII